MMANKIDGSKLFEEGKKKELFDELFKVIVGFIEINSGTAELDALKEEVAALEDRIIEMQDLANTIECNAADIQGI